MLLSLHALGPVLFAVYCSATGDIIAQHGVPQEYHKDCLTLMTRSSVLPCVLAIHNCQCSLRAHFQNCCINDYVHWMSPLTRTNILTWCDNDHWVITISCIIIINITITSTTPTKNHICLAPTGRRPGLSAPPMKTMEAFYMKCFRQTLKFRGQINTSQTQ